MLERLKMNHLKDVFSWLIYSIMPFYRNDVIAHEDAEQLENTLLDYASLGQLPRQPAPSAKKEENKTALRIIKEDWKLKSYESKIIYIHQIECSLA